MRRVAFLAALALAACSDPAPEGDDLPNRMVFRATTTAVDNPLQGGCGWVGGASWEFIIDGFNGDRVVIDSQRFVRDQMCSRDGLLVSCIGPSQSIYVELSSDGISGVGRFVSTQCAEDFTIAR